MKGCSPSLLAFLTFLAFLDFLGSRLSSARQFAVVGLRFAMSLALLANQRDQALASVEPRLTSSMTEWRFLDVRLQNRNRSRAPGVLRFRPRALDGHS